MRKWLAVGTAIAALAAINFSIIAKERHLATGRVVLLELAPVDPRSLMQGDYMALRFAIANEVSNVVGTAPADGRIVAAIDAQSIGRFRRLDDGRTLAPDEIKLRYRVRQGRIKFATNAFFFQEGTGSRHAGARYGELRVNGNGELLLTGLRGPNLEPLGQR